MAKGFLARFSKTTLIIIGVVVVLLIAIRIALPYIILRVVNNKLQNIPDYYGHVEDVKLHLWRGAYEIDVVTLKKVQSHTRHPFVDIPRIDFSVDWKELFHGAIVAKILFDHPRVNFVQRPSKQESQTSINNKSWTETLKSLFPLKINRFEIREGQVHFIKEPSDPKVDIHAENLNVVAENLTNSRKISKSLAATVVAHATIFKTGKFSLNMKIDPYEKKPTFNLSTEIRKVNLVDFNDFLRNYGKFDIDRGTFELVAEFEARKGRFEGYVKPFFKDLKIINWQEDPKNPLKLAWKAIIAGITQIFKNHPKDQVATKVPLSGSFEGPSPDIWTSIGYLLRNAFIQALVPRFEGATGLKDEDLKKNEKEEKKK